MATTIQNPRRQRIIVVKEATEGTLQAPVAGGLLVPAGFVDISQSPNFSDSEEIKESRDVTDRFQGRWNAGEFVVPMYLRPSGTAGTAPDGDVLFECLMGLKTVTASTSVAYTQAVDKPSFSLWRKLDEMLLWARGCVPTGMALNVQTGAGGAMVNFTGQFAEMGWCGTSTLSGSHSIDATTIQLGTDEAKKYKAGSFVEFTDGTTTWNNSDAGYEITAVDTDNDQLTITDGAAGGLEIAMDDGDTIQPWLPTGSEVGEPLEMRKAFARFDSTVTVVRSISLNIGDPVEYLEEITQDAYPSTYSGMRRDIGGTIGKMLRQADIADFWYGDNNTTRDLDLVVGDTAGSIVTFNAPKAEFEFPAISNADPTVEETINWKALGTSGEDSMSITFT